MSARVHSSDRSMRVTELRAVRFTAVVVAAMAMLIAATWTISLHPGDAPGGYRTILAAVLAVPALFAFASPWLSLRTVRVIMATLAVATTLLAVGLLVGAITGTALQDRVVWPLSITAVATAAALIAGGIGWALASLVVLTVCMQLLRLAIGGFDFAWLVNDGQAFLSAGLVLVLVGTFLRATRDLDRAVTQAGLAEERRASSNGRRAAGQHAQALVHDDVLATLLLVSQSLSSMRGAIASQAGRVLGRIFALERELDDAPVRRTAFIGRLTGTARRIAPECAVDVRTAGEDPLAPLDAPVAEAFAGATEQALVNSVRHAGDASRAVTIEADHGDVVVTVSDNGAGFDPGDVPRDRLGISTSIVGRMRAVGGRASVRSAPGRGTTVRLEWRAAADDDVWVWPRDDARFPRSARLIATGFCVFQTLMAVLISVGTGAVTASIVASAIALAGMFAGLAVLGWRHLARPAAGRAVTAAVITTSASIIATFIGVSAHGFVAAWALTAGAFVLAGVAIRGRPWIAVAALAGLVAAGTVVAVSNGFVLAETVAAIGRPLIVVGVAVTATLQLRRLWERTLRARSEYLATLRRTARSQASRAELKARAEELESLVGPTLERVKSGEWTPSLFSECAALEGQLRDRYRGGRLARPPLIEAAAAARRRGVDVVLLDDAGGREIAEHELDAVAAWIAGRLDETDEGRLTGRLLPPDSDSLASAVAGDGVWAFQH